MAKETTGIYDWDLLKEEFLATEMTSFTAFWQKKFGKKPHVLAQKKAKGWLAEKRSKNAKLVKLLRKKNAEAIESIVEEKQAEIKTVLNSYIEVASAGINMVLNRLKTDQESFFDMGGQEHLTKFSPRSIQALTTAAKNLMEVSKFAHGINDQTRTMEDDGVGAEKHVLERIQRHKEPAE